MAVFLSPNGISFKNMEFWNQNTCIPRWLYNLSFEQPLHKSVRSQLNDSSCCLWIKWECFLTCVLLGKINKIIEFICKYLICFAKCHHQIFSPHINWLNSRFNSLVIVPSLKFCLTWSWDPSTSWILGPHPFLYPKTHPFLDPGTHPFLDPETLHLPGFLLYQ